MIKRNYIFVFLLVFVFFIVLGSCEDGNVSTVNEIKIDNAVVSGILGAKVKSIGPLTEVVLDSSHSMTLKVGDEEVEYGDFGAGARFIFDEKGNIVEAEFEVTKDRSYDIAEYKGVKAPKGSNLLYRDGKIIIGVVAGSKVLPPEEVPKEGEVKYFTNEGYSMELENGEEFKGNLYFNSLGSYIDGAAVIGGLEVVNPEKGRMYFDYKGELNKAYDAPYISMDPESGKFVIATNNELDSPEVLFRKGNPYLIIEDKDYVSLMVNGHKDGSYVSFADRSSDGLVPGGESLNSYVMKQDNKIVSVDGVAKTFLVDDGKGYERTSTSPVDLATYRTNEAGEKNNFFLNGERFLVGNDIRFAWGEDTDYLKETAYVGSEDVFHGVSNRLSYNYPRVDTFQQINDVKLSGYYAELTSEQLRILYDFYEQSTDLLSGSIKEMTVHRTGGFMTDVKGVLDVSLSGLKDEKTQQGSGRMGILFHEAAHALHRSSGAAFYSTSDFVKEWKAVAGVYTTDRVAFSQQFAPPDKGYAYGYGSYSGHSVLVRDLEDVATFIEFSTDSDYWKPLLSADNRYNEIYRGKLAVATKYGFIKQSQFDNIFSNAGLATGANTLDRYIVNAGGKGVGAEQIVAR